MPTWWNERRFGIFVHSNLATVPAWAPIGEYSDWYRSHLGEDVADVVLHPKPMVEVLAHHRDRWGHIEQFDDFLPLLTYDEFDPEAWAQLVAQSGAGYSVFVAKHHDGWSWWDAPGTDRTMLHGGPKRNVLAEYAAACERNDIVFGTYYSLLDWGDPRFPDPSYVSDVLHPHVIDLVERYGSSVLWGDGHWGHGPDRWRTRELLDQVRSIDPSVVVNDRWWASPDDVPAGSPSLVRTFEYEAPDDIIHTPWELCRGLGASFCHNRAERAEHHLSRCRHRGTADRGRRQGWAPVAQHRPRRRRHDPRTAAPTPARGRPMDPLTPATDRRSRSVGRLGERRRQVSPPERSGPRRRPLRQGQPGSADRRPLPSRVGRSRWRARRVPSGRTRDPPRCGEGIVHASGLTGWRGRHRRVRTRGRRRRSAGRVVRADTTTGDRSRPAASRRRSRRHRPTG